MNPTQTPSGAHSLTPPDIAAQVIEIHSELDDLKSQRLVIEADLTELKKLRDASMPSRGGAGLDPAKELELQSHLAEDVAAIGKIKARAAELNAELNRLASRQGEPRNPETQNRNVPVEARFMREARAMLAPEVFAAILRAAQGQPRPSGRNPSQRHGRDNRGRHSQGGNAGQENRHHRGDRGRR